VRVCEIERDRVRRWGGGGSESLGECHAQDAADADVQHSRGRWATRVSCFSAGLASGAAHTLLATTTTAAAATITTTATTNAAATTTAATAAIGTTATVTVRPGVLSAAASYRPGACCFRGPV
jgi:hypothetical protein